MNCWVFEESFPEALFFFFITALERKDKIYSIKMQISETDEKP